MGFCCSAKRELTLLTEAAPGFERITIRPVLDPRVKRGGGDYSSVMGRISTDWEQRDDGRIKLNVSIPGNASARVHLPSARTSKIFEGRRSIANRHELRLIERSEREAVVEVGSGAYEFMVEQG